MENFVTRLTRAAKRKLPEYQEQLKLKEEKENKKKADLEKVKPFIKYPGKISYTTDFIQCATVCDDLLNEAEKVEDLLILGFDLEWTFSFQTGPEKTALMQICPSTNDQIVYLFQLSEFKKLPATLIKLIAHPKVRLAGVNIRNDIHKLCRDFTGINKDPILNNCVDSRNQARDVTSITGWSMDKLVNYFFDQSVDKNKKVRHSKWHVLPLSKEQKYYAATDAYVSLLLYKHLIKLEEEELMKEKEEIHPLQEII